MRKKKRKLYKRLIKKIGILLLLTSFLLICGKNVYHMAAPKLNEIVESLYKETEVKRASIPEDLNIAATSTLLVNNLVSQNAILKCLDDQKILLDKDSEEVIYPASLTKIMTAIVSIENLEDLNQLITLSPKMFRKLNEKDASLAGFLPNETVPAIDLLYGALLPSGAECCVGLSEYIAGSEASFVVLMNAKAKELNMEHSNFTNSTGLHNSNHYSCVADLAVLLQYSLQNDIFREIFTSQEHSTNATSLHPDGITFYSTMFKNMDSYKFTDGSVLGGKTGYTSEAGLCLASLAVKNGKEYIMVTAEAKGNHSTEQYNISDALYVYTNLK